MTPEEIHEFWFADTLSDPERAQLRMPFWFGSTRDADALIQQRFASPLEDAARGAFAHWALQPRSCLSLIIVLDQFPRNIHRGSASAFAYDAQALSMAKRGAAAGFVDGLTTVEHSFFLMPYQHSEDLTCQREGVILFERMAERCRPEWRAFAEGILRYARMHFDIIQQFGRFPHRNAILRRDSTQAERDYLKSNGESFGQSA